MVAAAAVAALVAGVVGLAVSQRDPVEQVPPASEVPAPPVYRWTTAEYTASARSFAIDVNGKTFVAEDPDIEVSGDPGTPTYQTLELTWQEHGVEMRWYVYFTSDGNEWWSNEFRTYDGNDPGEWVTFTGDFFRTPSGQPFTGDVDLTAIENGVTSHLTIGGLTLQPFLEFGPNGATVPTTTQPPLAEDIARAQAVVADAPPLPDDLRETGRWWLPEDELVLLLARTTIHQECMASAGFDYGTAPVDEWATYVGSWQPHVFLGMPGTRSASLGYQDVGSPQYERVYFESLDPEQQSAHETRHRATVRWPRSRCSTSRHSVRN